MNNNELFKKMLMNFDRGHERSMKFYDNLPYKRNYNLCNWKPLQMFSGNVIKYYQYQLKPPVIIQTDPDAQ